MSAPAWRAMLGICLSAHLWAGDVASDWQSIVSLDAGPQGQARTSEEARRLATAHVSRQEQSLREFLTAHPQGEHAFEARLRLARLLDIRAGFEGSERARVESQRMLAELEKSATPEQRVEVDFAKVARLMRGGRQATAAQRQELLSAARRFRAEHPGDRRVAVLLTEVATLFDNEPMTKTALLTDARGLTADDELKARINDDLRRLDLLGKPLPLGFTSFQGKTVKIGDYRGQPVVVVFFADFSPPSMEAVERVRRELAALPKGSATALGVSLDASRETLTATLKTSGLTWPVAFDGKSWEGEIVRTFGINALPTVWLLDQQGRLRSLNALEGIGEQVQRLLRD